MSDTSSQQVTWVQHECDTSSTQKTRVRYGRYTNDTSATQVLQVLHEWRNLIMNYKITILEFQILPRADKNSFLLPG